MSVEIQDIFAAHMTSYMKSHHLSFVQQKAARSIMGCRTAAALGAHIDTCDNCGYTKISYNSCRNRHCPKCQTVAKDKWIAPIPKLTDREKGGKLERKGAQGNGSPKGKKGDRAAAVR